MAKPALSPDITCPLGTYGTESTCCFLKELAGINLMAKASKHPPGIQIPHVTQKVRLPSGNSCHFPLKEKYDRQFRSIDGIYENQNARQQDSNVVSHAVCPEEHVDVDIPDTTIPVPTAGGSSSSGIAPLKPGVSEWMFTLALDMDSTPRATCAGAMSSTAFKR